jgi:hypothetical protein
MRGKNRQASWFATLRRDRGLFAVVGAFALLLSLLLPLAAAQNAAYQDLLVLCSTHAEPTQQQPATGPDCPLCPAGHLCGLAGFLAAPAQIPALALSVPATNEPWRKRADAPLPGSSGGAPPSIRAPPLSA